MHALGCAGKIKFPTVSIVQYIILNEFNCVIWKQCSPWNWSDFYSASGLFILI